MSIKPRPSIVARFRGEFERPANFIGFQSDTPFSLVELRTIDDGSGFVLDDIHFSTTIAEPSTASPVGLGLPSMGVLSGRTR
jgi:hypothetical protein